ncbi:tRNA glutamyl-Q(34) synthetase GluQRS [Sulfitobacter albidus]|uniref:tRNA glutamyl-Q(34) synthetase GluQRS n=1 Tax=Sulfitobacter albidus TaxID=2829501 RepID=A0A975JFI7_9RHOB|nr:tRNA glutamyl-Q(34) synthetase GluQRS [Sulfitobacter albidus]QUJ77587.1 tRNA glutamyl-Q(34) synthetase GluQRS [Sulfitobacter albidus]
MTFTTRFAPSPTGPLHLGHAYSALLAFDLAQAAGGTFLLRIEDIDRSRARPEWEAQITDDLRWLGLDWPHPVMRQSDRQAAYDAALDRLWAAGMLYPCTCTRRDIAAAASAPQEGAPLLGPDGVIYPGTCRGADRNGLRPRDAVLRLDMARACTTALTFTEEGVGQTGQITTMPAQMIAEVGDIVLARREMGTSYHLSVTLDDAAQGITHVVRGLDLFEATAIHVLLQRLLDLPTPRYHHHRLTRDEHGKRLAKRDDARAIALYRDAGETPQDIRARVGL